MSFILAAIAGFVTPMVEGTVSGMLQKLQSKDIQIEDGEYRTLTFALLLLGVAVLANITGVSANAFWLLVGGILGLFAMRIIAAVKGMTAKTAKVEEAVAEAAKD